MMYPKNEQTKVTAAVAVWIFVIAITAALVVAQVEPPVQADLLVASEAPAESEAPAVEETKAPPQDDEQQMEIVDDNLSNGAIQSISFKKDMSIKDALRFLALKYQKNIVPTQKVEGMITVTNLYDVTFEEALQAILGINKYEIQDNFIMVYTAEEYEQIMSDKRRMETKVFTLYYLTADEAEKLIAAILNEGGSVAKSSPAATGVPAGESISSDAAGGDNLAFQDTIIVRDYPETIAEVESLLAELDIRPKQVLIEATILTASLTEGMEFGVDLNFAGGVSIDGTAATEDYVDSGTVDRGSEAEHPISQVANWSGAGTPVEVAGFATVGGAGLRVGVSAGDFSAFITALEQITDVTILANPKIMAINKQLGQVYIGTKLGYREGDVETSGGGTQQGAVKFLDTGTKLAFRPYIGNDGYIRMDIHPKDSSGALNAQGVPDETSAELSTNVMVKDGQTVVIGGLFRDVVTASKSQVPILGDIPFIGEFFRSQTDITQRQEVIVLLTPHIIDQPDETMPDERLADIARKRSAAGNSLLWIGVSNLAEESYTKAVSLYSDGDNAAALAELNWALNLRPSYLEAIRLRERIIGESGSDSQETIDRIMIEAIEAEESFRWTRH
jgi:type IV pilus assembly protein PilQ